MKPQYLALVAVPAVVISLACGGSQSFEEVPDRWAPIDAPAAADAGAFPDAPDLGVTNWVLGEEVDLTTTDKVVLVEHWATWCGPCRIEFPHMTELQRDHADELVVIGLSEEPTSLVAPFVERNSDVMQYTVAVAPPSDLMTWSRMSGADSIPYSYLVQAGKVVWHGHPGRLMPVLPHVLNGTWNETTAKTFAEIPAFVPAYMETLELLGPEQASSLLDKLLEVPTMGADTKNELSWTILTEIPESQRDIPLAVRLAEQATGEVDHQNWAYEDTLGLALQMDGQLEAAIVAQQTAVDLCIAASAGPPCVELRERLESFERER